MVRDGATFDRHAFFASPGGLEVRPGGLLAVGAETVRYDPSDIASLLSAHLQLVRRLQPQQREASIMLRRDDITALADLLGETATEVIEKLGSLMGATRAQRSAMAVLFASGAAVIGLAATGTVFSHGSGHSADSSFANRQLAFTTVVDLDVRTVSGFEPVVVPAASAEVQRTVEPIDEIGLTRALEDPAWAPVVVDLAPDAGIELAPVVATGVASASPATDARTVETVGAPVPQLPPGIVIDADPVRVDIGSPPIPDPAPVPAASEVGSGGEQFEVPTLIDEPAIPMARPGDVLVEPSLVVDPAVPAAG